MKKKDRFQLDREVRLAFSRHNKNLIRNEKKRRKNRQLDYSPERFLSSVIAGKNGFIITAPRELSLYGVENSDGHAYTETTSFIKNIKSNYGLKHCVFDFSSLEMLKAPAIAAIYAAVETAYENGPYRGKVILPKNNEMKLIIKSFNLRKICEGTKIIYDFNLNFLPVISSSGKEHLEDIIDFIGRQVYKDNFPDNIEHKYGDAVSEAINNVGFHAYPEKDYDSTNKKWWLLCHVDSVRNQLHLVLQDVGVGIPDTIVSKSWFRKSFESNYPQEFRALNRTSSGDRGVLFFKKISDATKVGISMTGDVSGTTLDKHGQGSKSFKALVNQTANSSLWVCSRKGMYKMQSNIEPEVCLLPEPLNGTIIQWDIGLE